MHSARVLIVPLLLGLSFSSGPAAAMAAVPTGNQLRNGDAEAGAGSTDSGTTAPVPIPFWTTTGNFTEHVYDPAGSGAFPDVNVARKIGGGRQFFAGGPQSTDNTTERATQVVDLSPSAADVDHGGVSAALAADLGGFADQGDNARVSATFLAANGAVLGAETIGPVTAAQRRGVTGLLPRTAVAAVPARSRAIRVVITMTKTDGSYNDGYADNVSLTLSEPPVPRAGRSVNVIAASGSVLVRTPGGRFVPISSAMPLPSGTQVDARGGSLELAQGSVGGGPAGNGTFSGAVFSVTQTASGRDRGLTTLTLLDGARNTPGYGTCPKASSDLAHSARSSRKLLQILHAADRHGRFRTVGRYSAATVRGTSWDTADRCDGTLTTVRVGRVAVNDFGRHRVVVVLARHSYLARPHRP